MGKAKWFSVMLGISLLLLNSSQLVFADDLETPQDGSGSPTECLGGPTDNTGGDTTLDAGIGNIINEICIKTGVGQGAGGPQFGDSSHSELIDMNGIYGDDNCYTVSGLGTQTVMVTLTGDPSECHDISHVDYFIDADGGGPPGGTVGGTIIPIDATALLLANAQSTTWLIPVVFSIVGIGLFVFSRKSR